jgi:antitoxin YefM
MTIHTSLTYARIHLAEICDRVIADRDIVIVHRRGAEDMALLAVGELDGILETMHLLRSPSNAARLLTALARARQEPPSNETVTELRANDGSTG